MAKLLIPAVLFFAASIYVLVRTVTNQPAQKVEKRVVDNGQSVKQVQQQAQIVDALAKKQRAVQAPAEGKKPPQGQMNFTIPLEQLLKDGGKPGVLTIQPPPPPAPPKADPPKANDDFGSVLPNGLPLWFRLLDTDEDGQVALNEWLAVGKSIDEFRKYDRNGDGILTEDEVLRLMNRSNELKLDKGQARYKGAIEPTDDVYQGKKLSKIFIVKFEKGKTYQIDHMSNAFDAYLYLEGSDGKVLAKDDDSGGGNNARIVHVAATTGIYRIIATSVAGTRGGDFSLVVRMTDAGGSPKGMPAWFKELDKDKDGQVALHEWRASGKSVDEFRKYDLDGDGLITAEEVLRSLKMLVDLKFENDLVEYEGMVEEFVHDRYQGKKSFKILNIKLEKGKTYQIEHTSDAFFAYVYLEDSAGKIVAKHNSGGKGATARIVHFVTKAGTHRIIATSQDGYKTGDFTLIVRILDGFNAVLPKGLPPWFKELDKDGDGQVALYEWRESGKSLDEFHKLDLNGDGFLTPEEVLRQIKMPTELKIQKGPAKSGVTINGGSIVTIEPKAHGGGGGGEVKSDGAIAATDEKYEGKKLSKSFAVKLEKGKTYQIDLVSQEFSAYLYLEDPDGNFLAKIHSGGKGMTARIVHQAAIAGTYRIIATSQDGNKTGAFAISVRGK